jgi:hypothetical protein
MDSIMDLPRIVEGLKKEDRELFDRFFVMRKKVGELKVPKEMRAWADKSFGDYRNVEKQEILRIFNTLSFETALFNELRAKRPHVVNVDENITKDIMSDFGDNFCNPLKMTAVDTFGRVKGRYCISTSNIAKYDFLHGVIIFKKHNPLDFTEKELDDYLETALKWFKKANKSNKEAIYPYLIWNCLWRAGAGVIHGHMQTVIGEQVHYGEAEFFNHIRIEYMKEIGKEYFQDYFNIHKAIGLGFEEKDLRIFMNITPRKDKEVTILGPKLDKNFGRTIYKILRCLLDDFGVNSFNVGFIFPPLKETGSWEGFPVVVRILDRGSLKVKTTDMGGMEVYSRSNIIETDPYKVFEKIKEKF